MAELLPSNAALLAERWPELAARLGASAAPAHERCAARCPSVRVEGLLFASAYDRGAEARAQARRLPPDASRITVYGLGLGDLPRRLLERPGLELLEVVLLGLGTARMTFELEDHSDWLADERVRLRAGDELRELHAPFAVVPAELAHADEACLALRDALALELDRPHAEAQWSAIEEVARRHIEENRDLVASDADVAELFGAHPEANVWIVGPAPTLGAQLTRMQRERPRPLLVISTALAPVLFAGLVPDYVVMNDHLSIDPVPPEMREVLRDVPLVYSPEVQGATLRAWPGPRFAAYLERPRFAELFAELPRASLWTEGTVTHWAVDLALRLGAARVTMVGLDFAHPGGESHAAGTPDHRRVGGASAAHTLVDGFGERVPSEPNLIAYLRDLEGYVRRHAEVEFARLDRRGARMEGVAWLD